MAGAVAENDRRPILLAGPTASGKSRLALELAERLGGVVINADSMQVFRELRVLTARPDPAEEARVPHRLYGHVSASERYSVGRWLEDAAAALAEARSAGRRPILAGGTGLYFKALTEGLAAVPAIPADVRERLARDGENLPAAILHGRLAARDPEGAAALRPSDRGRILRALEVLEVTGVPLRIWHSRHGTPVLAGEGALRLVLSPDRAELHRRIDARVEAMLAAGAVDEVRRLAALDLDPAMPAMKAIGVRPLLAHLRGELDLAAATGRIQAETRQYAKRQATWFRHQMTGWTVLVPGRATVADVLPEILV